MMIDGKPDGERTILPFTPRILDIVQAVATSKVQVFCSSRLPALRAAIGKHGMIAAFFKLSEHQRTPLNTEKHSKVVFKIITRF